MHDVLVWHMPSFCVHLYVRLSYAVIVLKQLNAGSQKQWHMIAQVLLFV